MLHPVEGSITLDGIQIETLLPNTVRRRINVIPQDPFVQPRSSVRVNVDLSGTLSAPTLLVALDKVGLGNAVREHGGLDAPLEAIGLTSGQTKLLGLARALLWKEASGARSGILLLDEATAGMDEGLEAFVMQIVREEFQSFTVVAIAHRTNSILDFDRVIVMDDGRVAEVGDARELLQSSVPAIAGLARVEE
jgi:ABC-type multidrug transport system fused ATPase/permease subunit